MSSLAVSYVWQFIFSYAGPAQQAPRARSGSRAGSAHGPATRPGRCGRSSSCSSGSSSASRWSMYLAGLEGIPEELDEASAVDGASTFRRFRKVTLPLLAPAITVSVTLSTIYGLGVFDQVHRGHGRRARRRIGDARDADLQADVRLRPVRLRHRALARADGPDHRARGRAARRPPCPGAAALDAPLHRVDVRARGLLIVVAILWMIPFYFLVMIAVKPDVEALQSPLSLPERACTSPTSARRGTTPRSAAR